MMMKGNKAKISIIVTLILALSSALAFADTNRVESNESVDQIKIHSMKELKDKISSLKNRGKLTDSTLYGVMAETDTKIVRAFQKEKYEKAVMLLNQTDVEEVMEPQADGSLYGKKTYNLDDGCKAVVEFEDREDKNIFQKIAGKIVETSYAASNGEEMWKGYGNRYFTAKTYMLLGPGGATLTLENYYNLSASGITERYGVIDASSISINGGEVEPGFWHISDKTATKPGASDVNMYGQYAWSTAVLPGELIHVGGTWKLYTTIDYLEKDTANKKIKVRHSWKLG